MQMSLNYVVIKQIDYNAVSDSNSRSPFCSLCLYICCFKPLTTLCSLHFFFLSSHLPIRPLAQPAWG